MSDQEMTNAVIARIIWILCWIALVIFALYSCSCTGMSIEGKPAVLKLTIPTQELRLPLPTGDGKIDNWLNFLFDTPQPKS